MIYLSYDYLDKYIYVMGYLISRSIDENYSFSHIEKTIAYSSVIAEFESSNITTIAFSSSESIYQKLFPSSKNDFVYNPYDEFGWLGYIYINIFLHFQITFELIFVVLSIQEALSLYKLYHEMDITKIYEYFNSKVKHSYLDNIMKYKDISSDKLSRITGVPFSTIQMLRYKERDIAKAESQTVFKFSKALNVKMNTLITNLELELSGANK